MHSPESRLKQTDCSKSFLQRWFNTSTRCHVYICTLHACPEPQWAYGAPAPRPLLPLWWELNCSGWKQLGATTKERSRARKWIEPACGCACMCVWERDTRPDQCQHVGLIRLVITAWKSDGEKEGREGTMRERKQVEEHRIENGERKCRQRRSMTEGKCDGGWFNDEWRIGLSYLLKSEEEWSVPLPRCHTYACNSIFRRPRHHL